MSKSQEELEKAEDANDKRAEWCAWLVAVAVFFEFVLLAIEGPAPNRCVRIAAAVANLLVAGGVAGEVTFGRRSRKASNELRERAIDRLKQVEFDNGYLQETLAKTNERAAQANARASEATARALEIQLELTKLKAPRIVSAEQQEGIIAAVSPFAGAKFVFTVSQDPEARNLMLVFGQLLTRAGWEWQGFTGSRTVLRGTTFPQVGISVLEGLQIAVTLDDKETDTERAAEALFHAIEQQLGWGPKDMEGGFATIEEAKEGVTQSGLVHIRVGSKPI
ncbi:MAG TPA: hypothetical protein VGG27_10445 [Magnetospirillaceae bacterium]|jgi:uncharacterized membrane protein